MANNPKEKWYLTEEELIELVQNGTFTWVDYVTHYSPEWDEEFTSFCAERHMPLSNQTALAYIAFREDLLEEAMINGEA